MKTKTFLLGVIAISHLVLPYETHAQQDRPENSKAPPIEYYVKIERLDPVGGMIVSGGVAYHLLPDTRIWIDNIPSTQESLRADMMGLWVGVRAHDQDGARVLTALHLLRNETREQNPAGGLR